MRCSRGARQEGARAAQGGETHAVGKGEDVGALVLVFGHRVIPAGAVPVLVLCTCKSLQLRALRCASQRRLTWLRSVIWTSSVRATLSPPALDAYMYRKPSMPLCTANVPYMISAGYPGRLAAVHDGAGRAVPGGEFRVHRIAVARPGRRSRWESRWRRGRRRR